VFFSFIFESDRPRLSELIRALHTARRLTDRLHGREQDFGRHAIYRDDQQ
jgi:hypothetical protein